MSFFTTKSRAWDFASMSYRMIREHKKLALFPVFSTLSLALVCASFWLNADQSLLGMTGDLFRGRYSEMSTENYVTLFLFYFINYFCIVFFNSALFACVMQILKRGDTTLGFGLSLAFKRWHYIVAWSLVSAAVGTVLRVIERRREGAQLVSSLIGTAWAALTYFVVPVIVTDGSNPVAAVRESKDLLKKTWGTALMGNFSMGIFELIFIIPIVLIGGAILFLGYHNDAPNVITLGWIISGILGAIYLAVSAAAHEIFRAYTYAFATGRVLPQWVNPTLIRKAFKARK